MAPHPALAEIKKIASHASVYEPSDDSFLLVDAIADHLIQSGTRPEICVEIGCGSGYVIASVSRLLKAAKVPVHCIAVDINPCATVCTLQTLEAHQVTNVDLVGCDLLDAFSGHLNDKVDLLVFNPPYVPTPDEEVSRQGIAQAWAGGYQGREITNRLLPQIPDLLSEAGHCFIVAVAENEPRGMLNEMKDLGLEGHIVAQRQADEESLCVLQFTKSPIKD